MEYISIGKILNFHGIKGEVKIGFSNQEIIKNIKVVFVEKNKEKIPLNVVSVRFHKTFAIIKFREFNSINDLIEFKGTNIYLSKNSVLSSLDENEFLINDLIGLKAFDNEENYIGEITEIRENIAHDILCIKSPDENKDLILVPFVSELVPIVDIKKGVVIIKPIEGLL